MGLLFFSWELTLRYSFKDEGDGADGVGPGGAIALARDGLSERDNAKDARRAPKARVASERARDLTSWKPLLRRASRS
jgi:hypothetical protein